MTGSAAFLSCTGVMGAVSFEPFPVIRGEYLSDLLGRPICTKIRSFRP